MNCLLPTSLNNFSMSRFKCKLVLWLSLIIEQIGSHQLENSCENLVTSAQLMPFVQKGHNYIDFWADFNFCRIKLILDRLTCLT